MSSFTIFLLILVIVGGALGWRAGLTKQIGQIAGVILGIAACRIFGDQVTTMIFNTSEDAGDNVLYTILSYVALFLIVYFLSYLIMRMLRNVLQTVRLGILDRLGGAVFRVLEWLVLLSLALNLWSAIYPDTSLAAEPLYDRILWFGPYLLGTDTALKLTDVVGTAIHG